jgi:hypothetical protein
MRARIITSVSRMLFSLFKHVLQSLLFHAFKVLLFLCARVCVCVQNLLYFI